jgi:hypothetical protein
MIEQIKSTAEQFVQDVRPVSRIDFGYTLESVEWLEGYIERLRQSGQFTDVRAKTNLVGVFGSFLGECIIHCYGGAWMQRDEGWCVEFRRDTYVFPFARVSKQFDNGSEDGVGWFFRAIPEVFLKV